MDFGQLLEDAWKRFVAELVPTVIFVLVGFVLSLTIVLIPAVYGGFVRGFVGLVRDGRKPELPELWSFDGYLDIALLMLVTGVLTSLAYLVFIVPGVVLSVWWLYAGFLVVDRRFGVMDALAESRTAVLRSGFVNHLVILLILLVLGGIGGSLAGFGALLTTPFALTLLATVYVREIVSSASASELV